MPPPDPGAGDGFLWATGIEDTFIAQPIRHSGRILDEYVLTQHDRFWRDDLDRAASLGVSAIRYGIPWYSVNPAHGVFDWAWSDQALGYAADKGLAVILDLVHYGTPLWLDGSFADPRYPEAVAAYAGAAAERYRGLLKHYTPLNEPNVTALLCGERGWWPPYLEGVTGWVKIVEAMAIGMQRSIRAIRDADPGAVIVHVEATRYLRPTGEHVAERDWRIERQMVPTDLLLGLVNEAHQWRGWLHEHGMAESTFVELCLDPPTVDIMGVNYYPDISAGELAEYEGRLHDVAIDGGAEGLREVLTRFHNRYRRPVMLTETSTKGDGAKRLSWLETSVATIGALRQEGVPVCGYTWWPLFDLVDWNYAAGDRPLDDVSVRMIDADGVARIVPSTPGIRNGEVPAYLAPMGAWSLVPEPDGTLRRQETEVVGRMRELTKTVPGR